MISVELFSKKECHLCEEARNLLEKVRQDIPFSLREIKLLPGDPHFEEYHEMVPVVHIDGVLAFTGRVNEHRLRSILRGTARGETPSR